jgi:hypothetical protein
MHTDPYETRSNQNNDTKEQSPSLVIYDKKAIFFIFEKDHLPFYLTIYVKRDE